MINYTDIKLIALDLDDTTLNEYGTLSKRTRAAITAAVESGIHIVIASGRAYSALPKEIFAVNGLEYAITSNGAGIYCMPDDKCIHSCKLLNKSVISILSLQKLFNVVFEVFIDGEAFADCKYVENPVAFGSSPKAVNYIKNTRKPIDNMKDFIISNADRLDSIDIVVGKPDERKYVADYIKNIDNDIYITSSVPYLVEIAYKDAGKGSALAYLCEILGVKLSECVAFGNADNDIDMLRECGLGVAVANCTEGCKEAADFITDTNYNDGVAKMIEQILADR